MLASESINWFSKKQKTIAFSTIEAQYVTLSEDIKETI